MKSIVKKISTVLLALVLVFSIASCGQKEGEKSGEAKDNSKSESSYPDKPITMIIPYGAGGTTDVTGRKFAAALEKQLGQSIVIVNQSGASGSVATKTVLDSEPDGYTIFYTADSLGTQRVMGLSNYSYDDFTSIMAVVNDPKVIVVSKDSKYNTLDELINDIKERPGKVKMSYTGPGGSGHVQSLIYNKLGLDMALTAYSGGSDCIVAVLGNQVDFTNSNYSTVTGYLESGDLKLLGVSSMKPIDAYSDVPTLMELIPESEKYLEMPFTPLSLVVDKDCPEEVKKTLRDAALKAVEDKEWKDFVKQNSLEELYIKYPEQDDIDKFYDDWQSMICWLLWDAKAAKNNPADFDIAKPEE